MSAVSCQIWKRTWIFVLYQAVSFHIALDWRKGKTRRYDFLQQFFDLSWRTSSKPKTAVEHCDICLAWYYSQCRKYQWFTNPMLVRPLVKSYHHVDFKADSASAGYPGYYQISNATHIEVNVHNVACSGPLRAVSWYTPKSEICHQLLN